MKKRIGTWTVAFIMGALLAASAAPAGSVASRSYRMVGDLTAKFPAKPWPFSKSEYRIFEVPGPGVLKVTIYYDHAPWDGFNDFGHFHGVPENGPVPPTSSYNDVLQNILPHTSLLVSYMKPNPKVVMQPITYTSYYIVDKGRALFEIPPLHDNYNQFALLAVVRFLFSPGPPVEGETFPDDASVPPPDVETTVPLAPGLGPVLTVDEGGVWQGTWTRRPGTNIFDAIWRGPNGQIATDVVEIVSAEGNKITFKRKGNNGTYTGTLSPDGTQITGTASWYGPSQQWTGKTGVNPETPSTVKAVEGEWAISTGGVVGKADENKAFYSATLVISGSGANVEGKIRFANSGSWETISHVAFDGTILRFTRPQSAFCAVQQNYQAQIAGNRLEGTFTHQTTTQKWWGEKKSR